MNKTNASWTPAARQSMIEKAKKKKKKEKGKKQQNEKSSTFRQCHACKHLECLHSELKLSKVQNSSSLQRYSTPMKVIDSKDCNLS